MTLYSRDLKRLQEIKDAISEAIRFVEKAKAVQEAISSGFEHFSYSTSFAAAKRASMDLTRALAKMRGRRS